MFFCGNWWKLIARQGDTGSPPLESCGLTFRIHGFGHFMHRSRCLSKLPPATQPCLDPPGKPAPAVQMLCSLGKRQELAQQLPKLRRQGLREHHRARLLLRALWHGLLVVLLLELGAYSALLSFRVYVYAWKGLPLIGLRPSQDEGSRSTDMRTDCSG